MRWLFQVGQWTCPEIDHKVQTSKKFLITSHFLKVWSIFYCATFEDRIYFKVWSLLFIFIMKTSCIKMKRTFLWKYNEGKIEFTVCFLQYTATKQKEDKFVSFLQICLLLASVLMFERSYWDWHSPTQVNLRDKVRHLQTE